MITKAKAEDAAELKKMWETCFPQEDPKYINYFFKSLFDPDHCYVYRLDGKIVSSLIRRPHALMFNDRALRTSMLTGVCTLPGYRHKGYMTELLDVVLDACEHTELITLLQTETPSLYEGKGFRMMYGRSQYTITTNDTPRLSNLGCSFEPAPLDLLKVYSAFIKRFNGFYARDLKDFVNYKKEVLAQKGKIVAYYDGKDTIRGYASLLPEKDAYRIEEIVYLDTGVISKICSLALQDVPTVYLTVSDGENLGVIFPNAKKKNYQTIMARLNDAELFSKLFEKDVHTVSEAFALSRRPLNLNEWN